MATEELPTYSIHNDTLAGLRRRRFALLDQIASLQKEVEDIEQQLLHSLGGRAGTLVVNGVTVLKRAPRLSYAWARFSTENPEVVKQYTRPTVVQELDRGAVQRDCPQLLAPYQVWATVFTKPGND